MDGDELKSIEVDVDGEPETLYFHEGGSLMKALRQAGHRTVKNGCSEGICGACNVLTGDNKIVRSCIVPADNFEGAELTTAKGLVGDDDELHPIQEEFLNHGAAQCGFCIPGIVLSATQLLRKNPEPTDEEIRRSLNGNLCRCTGYVQQIEAIKSAAERMKAETQ